MLRDSAFRMAATGKKIKAVDQHEAYFKVLDTIDNVEAAERHPDSGYSGAGLFNTLETGNIVGSELSIEQQLVHSAVFAKK
jgi:hypothetical protein